MKVNLKKLEDTLNTAEVIYLATSKNDIVSARPISPLNMGLQLFIRTSANTKKAKEMIANPNVAVCVGNFYFTGRAIALGSAFSESNKKIKEAYCLRYPESFSDQDEFIQSDELFFEVSIEEISEWIYEGDIPIGLAQQKL